MAAAQSSSRKMASSVPWTRGMIWPAAPPTALTGPPIPAAALPYLFEPLHDIAAKRRSGSSSGLGLGLYISQQIALAHGANIEVHSDDKRTRFEIPLPRYAVATGRSLFDSAAPEAAH